MSEETKRLAQEYALKDQNNPDRGMFVVAYKYWRECSGSTQYSFEQIERVFAGVLNTWIKVLANSKVPQKDKDYLFGWQIW